MNKVCPVCGKFTFELFMGEINKRSGACNNCGFYYFKENLNHRNYDEQVKDWKMELAIMSLR